MDTCTYIYICMYVCICTYMHGCRHTYMHTCIHTYTQTYSVYICAILPARPAFLGGGHGAEAWAQGPKHQKQQGGGFRAKGLGRVWCWRFRLLTLLWAWYGFAKYCVGIGRWGGCGFGGLGFRVLGFGGFRLSTLEGLFWKVRGVGFRVLNFRACD